MRIPVLYNALAAARRARLVLTIPGTKTIELAVLGKPAITITPLNAPEFVTINGPLTYLDRMPFVGVPLKRAAAVAVSRRFAYHTQPNMDARRALIRELHGTVTPGRIARIAFESYDDRDWIAHRPARGSPSSIAITSARRIGWPNRCSALAALTRFAMDFSVVIATQGSRALSRTRADSLSVKACAPPFEVVVVDNGSKDETRASVERASAGSIPSVRYVAEPQPNRGKARNRGVEAARGRYVLFCDDDVLAAPGWIAAHAAAQAGGEDRVVNGPILNVPSSRDRPNPRPRTIRAHFSAPATHRWQSGVRARRRIRRAFDLYGWEDTELGVRLRGRAALEVRLGCLSLAYQTAEENTLDVESRKAIEKARMAAAFLPSILRGGRAWQPARIQ